MRTQEMYIYGFGGISLELAEIMTSRGGNVSGFVVDSQYLTESIKRNTTNIPVISFDDLANHSGNNGITAAISLGEPFHREKLSLRLESCGIDESGMNFAQYVSSYSSVGKGSILHIGSVVSSGCSVGKSCIINKNSIIGHDSAIGDYSVICPCVNIGGHVSIGRRSFVGIGASIRDRVKIGDNVIIGIGAVVTKDIESGYVAYGNPARIIRRNDTFRVFR